MSEIGIFEKLESLLTPNLARVKEMWTRFNYLWDMPDKLV